MTITKSRFVEDKQDEWTHLHTDTNERNIKKSLLELVMRKLIFNDPDICISATVYHYPNGEEVVDRFQIGDRK